MLLSFDLILLWGLHEDLIRDLNICPLFGKILESIQDNNSCFKYDTNKSRYKLDDSCIYVNNNANGNYDSVDLRVSVWAHIYHYASSTYQDFSPASRNGKIALVGAVRIPKKEKKFIYQYVYENGTDIAVNNGWSQNSYRIYADLLIQSGEDKATAGLWSPDSVGWYPAAEPYDKWCG